MLASSLQLSQCMLQNNCTHLYFIANIMIWLYILLYNLYKSKFMDSQECMLYCVWLCESNKPQE